MTTLEQVATIRGKLITFADQAFPTALCIAGEEGNLDSITAIERGELVVFSEKAVEPPGGYVADLPRGTHDIRVLREIDPDNPHAKLFELADKDLYAEFTPQ